MGKATSGCGIGMLPHPVSPLPEAGQSPTDVCAAALGSGSHVLLCSCSLGFGRKQLAGIVSPEIPPEAEAGQVQELPGSVKPVTMAPGSWRAGAAWKRRAALAPVTFSLGLGPLLSKTLRLVLTAS